MSLSKNPSVSFLSPLSSSKGEKRAVVSFAYDFTSDTDLVAFRQGAYGGFGSVYTLNLAELNNQNTLPEMKSMRVNATFYAPAGSPEDGDGALSIYNPQTSDLVLLGAPPFLGVTTPTNTPPPVNTLDCIVPMSVSPNGTLTFAKSQVAANTPPYVVTGTIYVTLFSWDVAPYSIQGQSAISGVTI